MDNLCMIVKAEAAPDNYQARYHCGIELFRAGHFEDAAREFEFAVQETDHRQMFLPKLFNYLAYSYYKSGEPQRALAAARTGLELFPDHAGLYLCSGQVSYEAKDYGAAYTFFAKCLSLPEQPDHYDAFNGSRGFCPCFYLGQLAEKFGNEEEALRYYIRGLRDNPAFVTALECIIRILRPREDPIYARECLEKLCELRSPQAHLLMAQILIGQGAFRLALDYYEQGMPEYPVPSQNILNQAICLIQQERHLEALRLFDLFTSDDPLYPVAKFNLLLCFWFQGNGHIVAMLAEQLFVLGLSADTGAVIRLLRDASNSKESFSVLLGEEGMALLLDILRRTFDLTRWKYGKELLNHLDGTCLNEYGLIIGRLWQQYGQLTDAKYYVRLYLAAHPDCQEAYGTLADLLQQTGSPGEAAGCYRQAIALEPREPEYYCKLYDLYEFMRQDVQAAARYGEAVDLETQECRCRLITLYNAMGQRMGEQVTKRFAAAAQFKIAPCVFPTERRKEL
ncbi:MAG: tetratricopeptide repeat protein [Veillonellales bacterium]